MFVVKKKSKVAVAIIMILIIFSLSITITTTITILTKNVKATEKTNNQTENNDLIEKKSTNKIYYLKLDSKEEYFKKLEEQKIKIKTKKINFSKIELEKNITATQKIIISKITSKEKNNKTNKNKDLNDNLNDNKIKNTNNSIKIDLYMHLNKKILSSSKKIRVYDSKNNLISETPFLIIKKSQLNSKKQLQLTIKLEIKPIETKKYCEEKKIKDIIPKEAYNINSPINLNETLREECTLILKHPLINYFKKIYLPEEYKNYTLKKIEYLTT